MGEESILKITNIVNEALLKFVKGVGQFIAGFKYDISNYDINKEKIQ